MSNPTPPADRKVESADTRAAQPAAAAEEESFEELFTEFERQHRPESQPSGVLQGTVIQINNEGALVDIGLKREGIILRPEGQATGPDLKAGDLVTVSVTGRNEDGYYVLSTVKVKRPTDWSSLEKAYNEKSVIGGLVKEVIRGGLSVDVGVRAFMPASRSGAKDAAEMEALAGQEIRCRIIQLDTSKEDVVVDRRVVLEEEAAAAREQIFAALQEGAVVQGTVRSLTDFGAFVDVGGIDGLLHVTDMAWSRINKPSDVLAEGDSIEVIILKVDAANRRISLGRKQLVPDPWSLVAEKYSAGARVKGRVVRLADFGAFVELEPGVDGLIHVSEMSWSKKARKPSDVLKTGEYVEAVVLTVNPEERRIGLGLKQALGNPWDDVETRFPVGSVVEGPVTSLAKFGAFIELAEGLEGMIHIADISSEKQVKHPREELSPGQRVRAAVLEIDRNRRRIRLGMKQLEPTTADEYIAEHKLGDVVSGRLVEVSGAVATVELGEGVRATCRLKSRRAEVPRTAEEAPRLALSQMSAMLAAKWKQGGGPAAAPSGEVRSGQIRSFRIVSLNPAEKQIEIELAG